MEAAAERLAALEALPYAGYVSDPCDGRTQGTPGMMDSLAYRNDAAIVFRRLIRSLPTRRGVLGVASCDKGLPALMMALAAQRDLRACWSPAALRCRHRGRGRRQGAALSARFDQGEITLAERRVGLPGVRVAGRRVSVPGHRGTSQVGGEDRDSVDAHGVAPRARRSGWTWRGARRRRWLGCGCGVTKADS